MTTEATLARRSEFARRVAVAVSEIPDRDSPEDQPEMMRVTSEELSNIIASTFEAMAEEAPVTSEHKNVIYTSGYDADGQCIYKSTRSSSEAQKDTFLMESFLELEQAKRLREVNFKPHKLGALWVSVYEPVPMVFAEAWKEISTHLHVYSDLIKAQKTEAANEPKCAGMDSEAYWDHELTALERAAKIAFEGMGGVRRTGMTAEQTIEVYEVLFDKARAAGFDNLMSVLQAAKDKDRFDFMQGLSRTSWEGKPMSPSQRHFMDSVKKEDKPDSYLTTDRMRVLIDEARKVGL